MDLIWNLPIVLATIFNIFLFFGVIICGIYGFVLFVKLAKRGIEALDIYIDKNQNSLNNNQEFKEDNI
jgi:hypothetical protein